MAVIAKLMVRRVVNFGTGNFVELGCVCDNDLMAAYATTEEDKLFSRYSPWGEVRLNQRAGWGVFTHEEDVHVVEPNKGPRAFYVMLLTENEVYSETFPKASAFIKMNCYSKSQFAGDGSRVELREVYGWHETSDSRSRINVIEKMSWKMHVDNPPAEAGFIPGTNYWVAFYDAAVFDRDRTISMALRGV